MSSAHTPPAKRAGSADAHPSTCPKCPSTSFVSVPAMVRGTFAISFIQCETCGCVVGTDSTAEILETHRIVREIRFPPVPDEETPTCPKCSGTSFEPKPAVLADSGLAVTFIQCTACRCVVGTAEHRELAELHKMVQKIMAKLAIA